MGGKGFGDEVKKTRFRLEPFRSEEERREALDNFRKYLWTLRSWDEAKDWETKTDVRDEN